MKENSPYVLITPARNEEKYIEKTILSVISQTALPSKWVIVSDGSTDRTDSIVASYGRKYRFIHLVRVSVLKQPNFASKVNAFYAGYEQLKGINYDFIGNLDADVTFDSYYYKRIITKFKGNERLGLVGGIILEWANGEFRPQTISLNSVAGAVQLFRRECFEKIRGYLPLKYGGIDAAAEIMVRMYGWKVQTFPDLKVYHHRTVGVGNQSLLRARFKEGIRFYLLGYHPLFYILRCLYRSLERPYFIGSIARLCGYFLFSLQKPARPVSEEFINYLRGEQLKRLKKALWGH